MLTFDGMESDIMEAHRHRLIVESAKPLLKLLGGEDAAAINEIVLRSKLFLSEYNNKNRTVIDMTKTEEGKWRSFVKKVVKGMYMNPVVREIKESMLKFPSCDCVGDVCSDECEREHENVSRANDPLRGEMARIEEVFRSACNSTHFDEDLKAKYILLTRRWKWPELSPLEAALQESIRTEVLTVFQNQNRELIQSK